MAGERILICEAERLVALDLQRGLQQLGCSVPLVVSRGEEAVDAAQALKPELILTEIHLPGKMDGIEAAALIRNRMDAAVIYLTTDSDRETLGRALSTNPDGYVLKPFAFDQLVVLVKIALHKHRSNFGVHTGLPEIRPVQPTEVNSEGPFRTDRSAKIVAEPRNGARPIPICACCKRIRDTSGDWKPLEDYFTAHFDLEFTHSWCPGCEKNFYR